MKYKEDINSVYNSWTVGSVDPEEVYNNITDIIMRVESLKCELDDLLYGTDLYPHYKAYGRYGFDQLLGNGNPHDEGLESLKKNLVEGNYCEDCGSEVEGEDTYCDHCNSIFEEQSNELANEEE